jgi:tetratricopeptide (TPR) repeat protein
MLMTASSLQYAPATVMLMAMLANVPKEQFLEARRTSFREVDAHFRYLLRTDPAYDILAVQALTLQKEGRPDAEALKCFDKAIQAAPRTTPPSASGSETPPAVRTPNWAFESICHQHRGQILLRQGRIEDALAAFKIVALELDVADGHLELAKLLPDHDPQRKTSLLNAAQAGLFEASSMLASLLADEAAAPGLSPPERQFARDLAWEWAQINPDKTDRAVVQALVLERFKKDAP